MAFVHSPFHLIFFVAISLVYLVLIGKILDNDELFDEIEIDIPDTWVASAILLVVSIVYEVLFKNLNGILMISGFGTLLIFRIVPTIVCIITEIRQRRLQAEENLINNFQYNIKTILEKSQKLDNLLDDNTVSFLKKMQDKHISDICDYTGRQLAKFINNTVEVLYQYDKLVKLDTVTNEEVIALRKSFDLVKKCAERYENQIHNKSVGVFSKCIQKQKNSFNKI